MFSLFGFKAVHDDVIELICFIFQQQGFVTESLDRIGRNGALIRLGNGPINRFQSQCLLCAFRISRFHSAVQRQVVLGNKGYIATGVDGTCHRCLHNISGVVLFLFPSHGQRAVAVCDEFARGIDGSKKQGTVLYTLGNASHAPDIGRPRRNVY